MATKQKVMVDANDFRFGVKGEVTEVVDEYYHLDVTSVHNENQMGLFDGELVVKKEKTLEVED